MKFKKIIVTSKDFLLNILATLLSTGIMQLVLYPQLAQNLSSVDYGTLLTVMGVVNVITLAFGNNLCNARLLCEVKYRDNGFRGDFQVIAYCFATLSSLLVLAVGIYFKYNISEIIGLMAVVFFTVLKSYYLVTYRLDLNYVKNLLANLCICIAYVVGAFLLIKFMDWPWLFAIASIACLVFIWFSSPIMREPFKKTPLMKSSWLVVLTLLLSGIIGNVTMYLDRFLIYPTLGGDSVSTYATAAFFSKSLALVFSPMVSVMLSYIVNGKFKLTVKRYNIFVGICCIGAALTVLIAVSLGRVITRWMYPTLYDPAAYLIPIVSCGIIIGIIGDFIGVVVLAYCATYWQIIISGIKLILYVVSGIVLIQFYDLFGLCVGVLLTNIFMLILNYFVAVIYLKKKKTDLYMTESVENNNETNDKDTTHNTFINKELDANVEIDAEIKTETEGQIKP